MTKLFDTHAHMDNRAFAADRDAVLTECSVSLDGVLNPGADLNSSRMAVKLAGSYPNIYAAVGFHPHEAKLMRCGDEETLAAWTTEKNVLAIGEIGLDYYYDHSPRDTQRAVFIRQLDLARQLRLPVIIHNRDAHGDMLSIIKTEGKGLRGVFHCYSGSWEMAKILLSHGFYLALGGSLTFKNAVKTVEVAMKAPMDRLLLETDAPYLAPVPFRGKRNQPLLIEYVCEKLANLRGFEPEEIASVTTANAHALFL